MRSSSPTPDSAQPRNEQPSNEAREGDGAPQPTQEVDRSDETESEDSSRGSTPGASPANQQRIPLGWSKPLADAVKATGIASAIQPFLPAVENLIGSSKVITHAMFISREVKVGSKTMVMRQTSGYERVAAVGAFADEIIAAAPGGTGATLDRGLLFSLLDSLLDHLVPEKASPSAASPNRASTSAGVARSLAATMVQEVATENRRQREMSSTEITERCSKLEPVMGIAAPNPGDLGHRQQVRYATDELETNQDIPRIASVQPLKMCDLSELPKKPGKEEDIEGATISCLLIGRSRVRRYVYTCMVAVADMPECKEICRALLAFDKAVQAASNITTFKQLQDAVDDAMTSAKNARDGECETKKSLAESYQAAARSIMNRNASIGVINSMGGTPTKKRGRDQDSDRTQKTEWKIKVAEGKYEWYKPMAGGNPNCPVPCTRASCKKSSKCAFNHKNLA